MRRGCGLINTGLLRVMAYNLLALARSVHLRRSGLIGWKQLRDWLRDALVFWGLVPDEPHDEPAAPA